MTISIRNATPHDLELIHELILALAEYEKLRHEVRADAELLRRHLFGPRPSAEVLIAEKGDEAIGFALFFQNFSSFEGRPGIYLQDLYVRPEARGKGAGKALFRRLAELAIERDCARLEWAVLDWNEPAIAFYRSIGARPMSDWIVQRLDGEALAGLAES